MIAAAMITKETVWFMVLSISTLVLGVAGLSCDTTRPLRGTDHTCQCVTANNIEWQLNGGLLSTCTATGICSPLPAGYAFQTDSSSPDKKYNLTVQGFDYSSCGVYSCTDLTTSVEQEVNLTIAAFDSSSPSVIVEPGNNTNGRIEITTECLFSKTDIMVEWVSVKGNTEVPYTPTASFNTATDCTDTCHGERAVKLNIGFTHTEDVSESTQTVKFGLKVYHKEDATNVLDLKTSSFYQIKASTPEPDCCFCMKRCTEIKKGLCIFLCIIIILVIAGSGIPPGMAIEAIFGIWGRLNQTWRIVSFFPFLFGLGLYLCDLIRQRCAGKGDKASNVVNTGSHPDEKKKQGRPQPPLPGANSNHREGSGSVVTGRDVEMQETYTPLKRSQSPDIHDRKRRGLSANYNDDHHPLASIDIPAKKAGALESIPDSAREDVKKKKKKRKRRVETEDDQSD